MTFRISDFGHDIYAFDSGYERADLAAIHLVVEGGAVAVIDTAVNASVPRVMEALAAVGRRAADVEYIVLTHVHLDHAGGAGLLMRECPNARLTVHPRGARHMIDPSKLWQATVAVYGAARATSVYGEILPIVASRVIETPDETVIQLGGRRDLRFLDTPGHARHHVAVQDKATGRIFAGDVFGISYRELDQDGRAFIIPTSSPTQFDPLEAHRSLDRIVAERPEAVYLTHYMEVREIPRLADLMHRLIDGYVAVAHANAAPNPGRHQAICEGLYRAIIDAARSEGFRQPDSFFREFLALDVGLNAQGLEHWIDNEAAAAAA